MDRRRTGDPAYVIVMKSTACTLGDKRLKANVSTVNQQIPSRRVDIYTFGNNVNDRGKMYLFLYNIFIN